MEGRVDEMSPSLHCTLRGLCWPNQRSRSQAKGYEMGESKNMSSHTKLARRAAMRSWFGPEKLLVGWTIWRGTME